MIKILQVVAALGSGGVETLLHTYYECMDREQFHFDVACYSQANGVYREKYEELGCRIFALPSKRKPLRSARALYRGSPIIVLDEPTAALDPIAEAQVYAGFSGMVGDRTAVYISHRLSSCRFCDEITVFDQGRIVQQGTHDELIRDPGGKYYELWTAQAQYYEKTGGNAADSATD